MLLYVKNWFWKSDFGTFWHSKFHNRTDTNVRRGAHGHEVGIICPLVNWSSQKVPIPIPTPNSDSPAEYTTTHIFWKWGSNFPKGECLSVLRLVDFFINISTTESHQGSSVNSPRSQNNYNSYMQHCCQEATTSPGAAAASVFYYVKSRKKLSWQFYLSLGLCAAHRKRAIQKLTHASPSTLLSWQRSLIRCRPTQISWFIFTGYLIQLSYLLSSLSNSSGWFIFIFVDFSEYVYELQYALSQGPLLWSLIEHIFFSAFKEPFLFIFLGTSLYEPVVVGMYV